MIIANLGASFQLAPDVMVMQTERSYLGGIY